MYYESHPADHSLSCCSCSYSSCTLYVPTAATAGVADASSPITAAVPAGAAPELTWDGIRPGACSHAPIISRVRKAALPPKPGSVSMVSALFCPVLCPSALLR